MMDEEFARSILLLAIRDKRCSEMLECLFDRGSVTIDMNTGKLLLIPARVIAASVRASGGTELCNKGCETCQDIQKKGEGCCKCGQVLDEHTESMSPAHVYTETYDAHCDGEHDDGKHICGGHRK